MDSEAPGGMRSGTTLVELILCIVILGIIGSVAVPMVRARMVTPELLPQMRVAIARRQALERGVSVTIDWHGDGASAWPITVWPDGRITADSAPSVERITGLTDTLFVRRNRLQHWADRGTGR